MLLRLCLLAFCVSSILAKSELDKIARMGVKILQQSRLPGSIRQCTCSEEQSCGDDTVNKLIQCSAGCYSAFQSITSNPYALKQCIDQKTPVLRQFLSCVFNNARTCTNNRAQPQVPHYNFQRAIQLGNAQLQSHRNEILSSGMIKNVKPVGNAAINFGMCIQNCYLAQNRGGFCFDRRGCNPLIDEKRARRAVKTCLKQLNWKAHAGQLCDCAMRAGVSSLNRFCPILRLMSSP